MTRAQFQSSKLVLPALLALDVLLRLGVAFRPFLVVDNLTIPDDAYISLSLARHLAEGHGPLAGLALTNGFQPLYVFLMVPAFWIWPHDDIAPVQAALVLLTLFDAITLWLIYDWIRRLHRSALVASIVAVTWIFSSFVMRTSLNGLETMISTCFIVASLRAFDAMIDGTGRARRLGLMLGFAIFARVDNFILAAALVAILLVRAWKERVPPAATRRILIEIGMPMLLVNAPWWIYSLVQTGALLPVSGEAVRFFNATTAPLEAKGENLYVHMFSRAVEALFSPNRELIVATAILGMMAFMLRDRGAARARQPRWTLIALGLFSCMLFCAYVFYVFGVWYFARYLFPLIVPLLLAFSFALHRTLDRARRRAPGAERALAAIATLALLVSLTANPQFTRLYTQTTTTDIGFANVGLWAQQTFPPGTRIGGQQTGALEYFARDLVVINLDGVVNHEALIASQAHRLLDYVKSVKVQYLVNWQGHAEYFLSLARGATAADVPVDHPIDGFRSWKQRWVLYRVRY